VALKFRLKGLAETFIEEIICPSCKCRGSDDENFTTDHTKVTFDGIIVVVQCRACGEIFVPDTQRLGVLNPHELKKAVAQDSEDSGEPTHDGYKAVKLSVEKLNAQRKGEMQ